LSTGQAETLWDCWQRRGAEEPDREAVVHWTAGAAPFRWRWGELLTAATGYARCLHEAGIRNGDVCALLLRHHPAFYPLYMAVSSLGALPSVLAYPNPRLHPDKFRAGLEGMALRSGLDWLITHRELEPVAGPLVSSSGSTVRGLLFPFEWTHLAVQPGGGPWQPHGSPDDPCLLQHSSGTTGLQKAVVLSHRAVLEHVGSYGSTIAVRAGDKVVSWLPFYHDMGLIACFHLPLALGLPLVQLDPFEWVQAPGLLVQAISRERGSLVWMPNFAFNFMADRVREDDIAGARLDGLRLVVNCSEPVRADSLARFHRRFAPLGLRREALGACYAMAETTFAATQTRPGVEAPTVSVDRDWIARGRVVVDSGPGARVCVSSGVAIPGCELRVVDPSGDTLPEDAAGEIAVRSASLFDGYRNDAEKTRQVLRDGWYRTGDYGFRYGEDWYVIGRRKDIIIVAGRNIYPEDVEDAVFEVPQVVPGRAIAFGVEDEESGTEKIVVVAETALAGRAERKRLCLAIRQAAMAIDVTVSHVCLAPPRWLIKSSSGKLSRRANRERALRELALE
jgi:fatty-acyl-CoA synthase